MGLLDRKTLKGRNAVNSFLPFALVQGCSVSQESWGFIVWQWRYSVCIMHAGRVNTRNDNPAQREIDRDIHTHTHPPRTHCHSLRGEARGPAPPKVLAMTRSAICLRARRPVGLLPFVIWSWIRPSNSSLNTCGQKEKTFFPFMVMWGQGKGEETQTPL